MGAVASWGLVSKVNIGPLIQMPVQIQLGKSEKSINMLLDLGHLHFRFCGLEGGERIPLSSNWSQRH